MTLVLTVVQALALDCKLLAELQILQPHTRKVRIFCTNSCTERPFDSAQISSQLASGIF